MEVQQGQPAARQEPGPLNLTLVTSIKFPEVHSPVSRQGELKAISSSK